MSGFKDHFSSHAADYAAFRPRWPPELFSWLSGQVYSRDLAWDCATGNGQAARALAAHFRQVIATDASGNQIQHALPGKNIDYRVEPAEKSSLADNSVDLIVVAQAIHWLELGAFLAEADRVMRPGGLLAIGAYQLPEVNDAVNEVIRYLWGQILDGWWPPERALVDRGLEGLDLPWPDLDPPAFEITAYWNLSELLDYLGTWSSVRRYQENKGENPIDSIAGKLNKAWGNPPFKLRVAWPISLRLCRKPVARIPGPEERR